MNIEPGLDRHAKVGDVERRCDPKGPWRRPPTDGEVETVRPGVHVGAPARQPEVEVGGARAVDCHEPNQF